MLDSISLTNIKSNCNTLNGKYFYSYKFIFLSQQKNEIIAIVLHHFGNGKETVITSAHTQEVIVILYIKRKVELEPSHARIHTLKNMNEEIVKN